MRLSSVFLMLGLFAAAAGGAYLVAGLSATWIENTTQDAVDTRLNIEGHDWSEVQTDGLQVIINGEAPSEADRFKALAAAGTVVEAARVIDNITIEAAEELEAPEFSIEILRNSTGISLIGLIPAQMDKANLLDRIQNIDPDQSVADFLETADYPVEDEWTSAVTFGLAALDRLERSKISVTEGRVAVEAISDSEAQQSRLETDLARRIPSNITAQISISAPRPVITPFTTRFRIDEEGARFDACSADSPETARATHAAAVAAGYEGKSECRQGLGVPSPHWADAVAKSIAALGELGGGTVTLADADVSLVAAEGTDKAKFDVVTSKLEADLPDVFALTSVLLVPPVEVEGLGPVEFQATLSPEGQLQMRGDVADELAQQATVTFARAKFGSESVFDATRQRPDTPRAWNLRTLAALAGLAELRSGLVEVTSEQIAVTGRTGNKEIGATLSQLFTNQLGAGTNFELDVTYVEALDPTREHLEPKVCVARIVKLTDTQKISFEPGSSNLDALSRDTVDRIAEILVRCPLAEIEIAGHTDSQGREEMNLSLSQSRAGAVLSALRLKRVKIKSLSAEGYGESQPIEDNGTEAGREANRRIEFRLITATPEPLEDAPQEDAETPTQEAENE